MLWKQLWSLKIHARLRVFLWRVLAGVIPPRDIACPICNAEVETLFHLFKECQGVKAIAFASAWGFRIEGWEVENIVDIISHCIHPRFSSVGIFGKDWHSVFFSSLLYCCWLYRNKVVHEKDPALHGMVVMFNRIVSEDLGNSGEVELLKEAEGAKLGNEGLWTVPPAGWLKANTDAAFKNGKAGLGLVIRDETGELVLFSTKTIACISAKVAELMAIEWASEIAERERWLRIVWSSDALELVKAINEEADPEEWDIRLGVLLIRNRQARALWEFC